MRAIFNSVSLLSNPQPMLNILRHWSNKYSYDVNNFGTLGWVTWRINEPFVIEYLSKQSLNSASTSNNGQSVSMYAVGKNSKRSGNGTERVTDAGLLLLVSILK